MSDVNIADFTNDLRRDKAKVSGKLTYKSVDDCRIAGHGFMRYVRGKGCVVCADQRRAKKDARVTPALRDGVSSTREYRLWQAARQRAEAKGSEFTITVQDIIIPTHCPVFGTLLTSPSLDRFDNAKGYTPQNIRVISRRANTIKSDATFDEILAVARYMAPADEFDALLG